MNEKEKKIDDKFSRKKIFAYGIGQFSDTIALEMFSFFIFTFYYAVVGLNINLITIVFIIWSVWNAINDPLLGALSDRTKTKWGRRKPYIIISIIPLCVVMIFLWIPPRNSEINTFIYFLIMVILFDLTYTLYDLNYASLFPEMFKNLEDRARAGAIKQLFTVIGLIFAFIGPTLFIPKLDDPKYYAEYGQAGIFMSIIIAVGAILMIIFGIKERKEYLKDAEEALSLLNSLKFSLKNKSFRIFIVANLAYWYVIGILPTIVPLYGSFVLNIGEGESILLGLMLGLSFISAGFFMIFWRYIAVRIGMKKGYMLCQIIFIATLFPFMLIKKILSAFIAFFFVGLGLAGALMLGDILLSAIIDEDELNTGLRREGGYYGINALITKLSTIFVILSINIVFNSVGWTVFTPENVSEEIIFGLRSLIFIFPAIALIIGFIVMSRFPITKEKYLQIKKEVEKLHEEKKESISSD